MLAGSQLDLCIGLDVHLEMVPPGVPTPFPMPFVGMVEWSPVGTLLQLGIAKGMSAIFGGPTQGPVLVYGLFQAVTTGDEASNTKVLPHFPIPPGTAWTPLPKPLKLKIKPPPPKPDVPAAPPGDAVLITGSKTVLVSGANFCRLGDIAMSCSDPVRLPSSILLSIPKGGPVLVGGPPALDFATAAKTFLLRNKWTAGALHQIVNRIAPGGRLRNLLSWGVCQLTGHPVDVATGRLLTRAADFTINGPIPITFERFYSSAWSERHSPLGYGWSHTLHEAVWVERGKVVYKMGDGREVEFHCHDLPGRYLSPGGALFYAIDRLTLRFHGDGRYEISSADGLTREFSWLPGNTRASFLTRIRDRLGHTIDFTYDRDYLLETVATSEGRWIRFEHRDGLLSRVAVPIPEAADGWYNHVTFDYSADGDLVRAFDSQGKARLYEYENHLLVQETDRDGVSFWFEFDGRDSHASCVRTWGSDGKGQDRLFFREITYDKRNSVTFVEDSLGHTTTFRMNIANAVEEIIDPHGARTRFAYNDFLWKTAETDALGNTTRYEYDSRGNETKCILPSGVSYTIRYNSLDLPTHLTDVFGNSWTWSYDTYGRVTLRGTPSGPIFFEYAGRYLARMVVDDKVTAVERTASGEIAKLTLPDGATEERWYDRHGRLVKVRTGNGKVRRTVYDWEARVIEEHEPGGITRFTYSPEGDLIAVHDAIRAVKFAYCGFHKIRNSEDGGALIQYVYSSEDELVGIVNERGETYSFERDACGRVTREITFDGRTHSYQRNALGWITTSITPGAKEQKFEHNSAGLVTRARYADGFEETFTYDAVGALETATNAVGTVRIQRDRSRRIVAEHFGDHWVASRYQGAGARTEVTSSFGLTQHITRSPMGEVEAVGISEATAGIPRGTWRVAFERDNAGNELRRVMPGNVSASWTRNDAGLPSSRTINQGAKVVSRSQYAWAGDRRLAGIRRVDDEGTTADTLFQHDSRNRLFSATMPDGSAQWRVPDITGHIYKSPDGRDREYGPGGILTKANGTKYFYDEEGNLSKRTDPDGSEWRYSWNATGSLAQVVKPDGTRITFFYDALGRRIAKTTEAGITWWLWDRNVPVHEFRVDDQKTEKTTWLFEPESIVPLAKIAPDGQKYSIITDYLGTPTEMFNAAGELAWRAQLDLYGVPAVEKGDSSDCPWRWPGQYHDHDTGLYYSRFRYYSPDRGDYVSHDPIRWLGGLRLYGYCPDPLAFYDPYGLGPPLPPLKPYDIDRYGSFGTKNRVGDGLEGHEMLQNAWLREHGFISDRGRGPASRDNPAIALTEAMHDKVSAEQVKLGLHDKAKLKAMSAQTNIDLNCQAMRNAGVPEVHIQAHREKAEEHYKACNS